MKSELLALTAVLFWSTVATAFKLSLRYLTPLKLLFIASLVSLTIYTFWVLVDKSLRASLSRLSRQNLIKLLLLGFLNPALYYVVLFKAYDILPAQIAQPLNYSWPIVLSVLAIPISREHLEQRDLLGLLIGFIGVWFVSSQGNPLNTRVFNPLGVFLALSSSLIWATYWLINSSVDAPDIVKLWLNFLAGVPLSGIILLLVDRSPTGFIYPGILGGVYVGIFEMGLTFIVWLKAISVTTTKAKVANLIYLSPVLSLFFIWRILGESIYWTTIAGLVLIITGIIVQRR